MLTKLRWHCSVDLYLYGDGQWTLNIKQLYTVNLILTYCCLNIKE